MIVACEKCDTRFQLDDAKVPAKGVRVRCSQCKHAFFVRPPDASDDELVHSLASEAAERGAPSPPDPTQDLGDTSGIDDVDEEDWQFNEYPPTLSGEPDEQVPLASAQEIVEALAAEDGVGNAEPDSSRSEFGTVEDWSSTATASPGLPAEQPDESPFADPSPADPIPELEPRRRPRPRGVSSFDSVPSVEPSAFASSRGGMLRGIAEGLGWIVVLALFAVGAYGALGLAVPRSADGGASETANARSVAGLSAEDVAGHWIENVHAGTIYVVSGVMHNRSGQSSARGAALHVQLQGRGGEVLDVAPAAAGTAINERDLRERRPELIARALASNARQRAWRPLAPGRHYRFNAIFVDVPADATAFRLDAVAVPAPSR